MAVWEDYYCPGRPQSSPQIQGVSRITAIPVRCVNDDRELCPFLSWRSYPHFSLQHGFTDCTQTSNVLEVLLLALKPDRWYTFIGEDFQKHLCIMINTVLDEWGSRFCAQQRPQNRFMGLKACTEHQTIWLGAPPLDQTLRRRCRKDLDSGLVTFLAQAPIGSAGRLAPRLPLRKRAAGGSRLPLHPREAKCTGSAAGGSRVLVPARVPAHQRVPGGATSARADCAAAAGAAATRSGDRERQCPQRPVHGDIDQQEMAFPSKKSAILVDGVVLNGPTTDTRAGEKFVEEACRIIMEEVILKATDVNEKVCEWQPPEQLKQLLDLEMRDTGEPHDRLLKLCRDVIRFSVKTNHPRFFNQLYAGLDYYSLVARFITEALNPSVYTYEVSPVFILVEEAVLKKMIEFIGWEEGDGIFNPGGSVSNMYAMNLARYKYCPDIKEKGLSGLPRLILFTSAECHYSMKKSASFLGIGTENVCFVETDGRGKMIPEELEKQVLKARKEVTDMIKT
nr:acidic amino acid decarboxylase GADL1-like [Cavia porcellus]